MTSAAEFLTGNMISGRRAMHRIGVLGLATALPLLLIQMLAIPVTNASV